MKAGSGTRRRARLLMNSGVCGGFGKTCGGLWLADVARSPGDLIWKYVRLLDGGG